MSGLVDVAVVLAVVVVVLARQIRPRRVAEGGRWWLLPAVLVFFAVRRGGIVDPHHEAVSVGLLVAEILIGTAMGVVWALTTRIWRDDMGIAWAKGTKATALAWAGGILSRIGLAALGAAEGVHQGGGATMLALAVTLSIRTGVVAWRARSLEPLAPRVTAAP